MENFDRLDRIEALVEKIGQRVDSNARAIEAISANTAEYQKDRARMYQFMADLAQTQADLAQSQAELAQAQAEGKREMYRLLGSLEEQQARFSQQQAQFSKQQTDIVQILKLLVAQKESEVT